MRVWVTYPFFEVEDLELLPYLESEWNNLRGKWKKIVRVKTGGVFGCWFKKEKCNRCTTKKWSTWISFLLHQLLVSGTIKLYTFLFSCWINCVMSSDNNRKSKNRVQIKAHYVTKNRTSILQKLTKHRWKLYMRDDIYVYILKWEMITFVKKKQTSILRTLIK